MSDKKHFIDYLWDLWCITSVVGIWPRFIEPNLMTTTKLTLEIPNLAEEHRGLKILQLSDLHLHPKVSNRFLRRLNQKITSLNPDLIVLTGDYLCLSVAVDPERLKTFLKGLNATHGCYAIFGNHDYEKNVSINESGEYDILEDSTSMIGKGFSRLLNPVYPVGQVTEEAKAIPVNQTLLNIFSETSITILDNRTIQLNINNRSLNLCGLGEYTLGRCLPDKAFREYDANLSGVILSHNPDSVPMLTKYPGDLILCGHTHGAQINLPFIWNRLSLMEQPEYKRGLFNIEGKWLYINRGIGSTMPFRWGSTPEITLFTLT